MNKKIEERAINIIDRLVLNSSRLESDLKKNDKTPSFDGTIVITPLNASTKAGRQIIDVQIKGTRKTGCLKSFSLDISDLGNYLEKDGCLLLVVQLGKEGGFTIYYNELLPHELVSILSKTDKTQKTKTVSLSLLENDDLEWLCTHYYADYSLQKRASRITLGRNFLPAQQNAKIELSPKKRFGSMEDLVNAESLAYELDELDNVVGICCGKITDITKSHRAIISSADGSVSYGRLLVTMSKDEQQIKFGDAFSLSRKSKTFTFNISGGLHSRLKQANFIMVLASHGFFYLNGEKIACNIPHEAARKAQNLYLFYKEIADYLRSQGIEKDLALDNWSSTSLRIVSSFIQKISHNSTFSYDKICQARVGVFREMDLALSVISFVLSTGEVVMEPIWHSHQGVGGFDHARIYSLLSDDARRKFDFRNLFLGLGYECFQADDVDIEEMISALKANNVSDELVNWHLIQVLKAFDECDNQKLLIYARWIIDRLLKDKPEHEYYIINNLQIKLRENSCLDDSDKENLIALKERTTDALVKISAELLLGEKDEAKYHLKGLSDEKRKSFLSFPIAKFLN